MKQRILLADDNEDIRTLCTCILEVEGYEVLAVDDGQAAYEAFLQDPPALLITDLSMPQMDGFALIRAIKKVASIPIILFTAYGRGRLNRLKPLGVDLVLDKPVEPEELTQAIKALLLPSSQQC